MSHPNPRSISSASSRSTDSYTSDFFCLSSSFSSQADVVQPTSLTDKATLETQPIHTIKVDPSIYSFAWSTNSENPLIEPENMNPPTDSLRTRSTSANAASVAAVDRNEVDDSKDSRCTPPSLPHPVFWSTLTHREHFREYIKAEGLVLRDFQGHGLIATSDEAPVHEPVDKAYGNIEHIIQANIRTDKILESCTPLWFENHLLSNSRLPKPFNWHDVANDPSVWTSKELDASGSVTFAELPDLTDHKATTKWLNYLAHRFGIIHGMKSPPPNVSNTNTSTSKDDTWVVNSEYADRTFTSEGCNKVLAKGLIPRKPDIVVIDRDYRRNIHTGIRLRWSLVQALVEVTASETRFNDLMKTLMEKASNVFDSQLHRHYILGLVLMGKGQDMKFFLVMIDRVGVVSTVPTHIGGHNAMSLARIIFAFTYGNGEILGADTNVTIDRLSGNPLTVKVEEKTFKIVTELHASPYLFSRGTRVYIVEDQDGCFHILKDSWILATHTGSEIEHIKKISATVQAEGLNERAQILSPRFVAGENAVRTTAEARALLPSRGPGRIRRRIVTGPIGDPITSYRSRVECLQALIDVVEQLEFLHDKCDLIHADISINNIVIVRFLPNIIAASSIPLPHTTGADAQPHIQADQQLVELPSGPPSSSQTSPTTARVTGNELLSEQSDSIQTISFEEIDPCTDTGLEHPLSSGGCLIDFDYTLPKNTLTMRASGTMPYMALDLMKPSQPVVHRLRHDLQSVALVFLHIVRFLGGPAGVTTGVIPRSHRIAQWHHEHNITVMKDQKGADIRHVRENPAAHVSQYWRPLAPYVAELLSLAFSRSTSANLKSDDQAFCQAFKGILIKARDQAKNLGEMPYNYAAFVPPEIQTQTQGSSKKRARATEYPQQPPAKRRTSRRMTEDSLRHNLPALTRNAQVVSFHQFKDSSAYSGQSSAITD